MIQLNANDLLQSGAGQFSATQFIQNQLPALAQSNTQSAAPASNDSSQVSLSGASRLLNALHAQDGESHPLLNALRHLVEQLTGQKVDSMTLDSQELQTSYASVDATNEALSVTNQGPALDYRYHSFHAEAAQLSFSAAGTIKLKDGTELTFDFQLELSQVTVEDTQARVQINGAQLGDPRSLGIPGISARLADGGGIQAHLDHQGLRRLLEGIPDDEQHRDHDHGRHVHGRSDENFAERTASGSWKKSLVHLNA